MINCIARRNLFGTKLHKFLQTVFILKQEHSNLIDEINDKMQVQELIVI